jgi:hypothetical protein
MNGLFRAQTHGVFYNSGDALRFLAVMLGIVFIVAVAILLIGGAIILYRRLMTEEDNRVKGIIQGHNRFEDRLRALEHKPLAHNDGD